MSQPHHVPVMMREVLELLPLRPGIVAVDGTVGLAGHSFEIAKRIAPGGLLIATDWDKEMLRMASEKLEQIKDVELSLHHADFRALPEVLARTLAEKGRRSGANAMLLDLGLNNAQLEDQSRGMSFQGNGPLDMRFDQTSGRPLKDHIAKLSAAEIEDILFELGDERWARKIAGTIVERRKQKPLVTTQDLVECVLAAIPPAKRDKRINPATRTFQAFRIYVNDELAGLESALMDAARLLAADGVLVILSFHSGEDRAAKLAIKQLVASGEFQALTKKPLVPSAEEISTNPKSRSTKLRAVRRIVAMEGQI